MKSYAAECVAYLYHQIDPHDRMNPKYAFLHAQIEAITKAVADVTALEIPSIRLRVQPDEQRS